MDCREFLEKRFQYPEIGQDFFEHLKICPNCQKEWEEWRRVENLLSQNYMAKEIEFGWKMVSLQVNEKLQIAFRRKMGLVALLTLGASLISTYTISFFLFRYLINEQGKVALPLIFYGLKTLWIQISYPFYILGVILLLLLSMYQELNRISNRLD